MVAAGGDSKPAMWRVSRHASRHAVRQWWLGATGAALLVVGMVAAAGVLRERTVDPASGSASVVTAEALTSAAMRLDASDQQGLGMANQAVAQSSSPTVRAAAATLATAYGARLDAVRTLLDRAGVSSRARFAAPLEPPADRVNGSGVLNCDLLADDEISRLADAPPETFDAVYRGLAGRHAVGGMLLTDELAARSADANVDATELSGLTDAVRRAAAAI